MLTRDKNDWSQELGCIGGYVKFILDWQICNVNMHKTVIQETQLSPTNSAMHFYKYNGVADLLILQHSTDRNGVPVSCVVLTYT